MKSVNIARFKSELGKYLGYIRHGEEVVVLDRSRPLAKVIPFEHKESKLIFEEPLDDPKKLYKIHLEPISKQKFNSLTFLLEERGER